MGTLMKAVEYYHFSQGVAFVGRGGYLGRAVFGPFSSLQDKIRELLGDTDLPGSHHVCHLPGTGSIGEN